MNVRHVWILVFVGLLLCAGAIGACSDDDDDNDDDNQQTDDDAADDDAADDDAADDDAADDDTADDDDDATPPPGCDTLHEGLNAGFMVNGISRSFYLDLPEGVAESWPWPVIFSWHGFGDTSTNFRSLIDYLVDNERMPFIGVTLEDSNMIFDWDLMAGTAEDNREVALFDALLAELDKCWGVDPQHIHSMGFSFGGGVSDLLGSRRGEVIASIATCSGVYGSNPANVIPYAVADWPDLSLIQNKYVEFRLHGGVLDNMVLPFGQYGANDVVFLNEKGHDAIECIHPYIHNMGFMYMGPETFIEFFADHPLGTTVSPYKDGLPADYGDTCVYLPKD